MNEPVIKISSIEFFEKRLEQESTTEAMITYRIEQMGHFRIKGKVDIDFERYKDMKFDDIAEEVRDVLRLATDATVMGGGM